MRITRATARDGAKLSNNICDHELPAIDQHKQHQFERQRNHDRRQHQHAHGDRHAGDHDVEHQKRKVI